MPRPEARLTATALDSLVAAIPDVIGNALGSVIGGALKDSFGANRNPTDQTSRSAQNRQSVARAGAVAGNGPTYALTTGYHTEGDTIIVNDSRNFCALFEW